MCVKTPVYNRVSSLEKLQEGQGSGAAGRVHKKSLENRKAPDLWGLQGHSKDFGLRELSSSRTPVHPSKPNAVVLFAL